MHEHQHERQEAHESEYQSDPEQAGQGGGRAAYLRFGAMIATSTVVMYALTYTNLFAFGHAHWSEERLYMAVLMGSAMTIVMLLFMWHMHRNTTANIAIVVGAVIVGGGAFALSQTQALVGDEAYMTGMIPHHSIAILTSERSDLDDVRVRELADGISQTQVEEIREMEWLLRDIADNGVAATPGEAAERPVPDFADDASAWLCDPRHRLLPWPAEHSTLSGEPTERCDVSAVDR